LLFLGDKALVNFHCSNSQSIVGIAV